LLAAGGVDVTGSHLHHTAAMRGAAHDVVAHVDSIHDVEREQGNVRSLEHVAAGVEHDVRRFRGGALCVGVLPEAG
jgi:hypothetical protein